MILTICFTVQPPVYRNSNIFKYYVIIPKVFLYELGCMSSLRISFLVLSGGKGKDSCGYTQHVSKHVNNNVMTIVHTTSLTI